MELLQLNGLEFFQLNIAGYPDLTSLPFQSLKQQDRWRVPDLLSAHLQMLGAQQRHIHYSDRAVYKVDRRLPCRRLIDQTEQESGKGWTNSGFPAGKAWTLKLKADSSF